MYNEMTGHKTVYEYLQLKVKMKNNFNIKKKKKKGIVEYPINHKLEKFIQRIVSVESIKTYGFFNYQFLYEILENQSLPLEYKTLNCRIEDGKMVFYYTNEQILNFVKLLKAAYLNSRIFREFIVIPDVYYMLINLYDNNIFFHDFINVEGLSLKCKDVINILDILGLKSPEYLDDYYLLSGCSLMMYGLREEVGDIDLVVNKKAFDMLNKKFNVEHIKENKYRIGNIIEIFLKEESKFECKRCGELLVEDLGVILNHKKKRVGFCSDMAKVRKDTADIENIRQYLKVHRNY